MTEDELRRGLLAILYQADIDGRYRSQPTWQWPVVREARDAYGTDGPRLRYRPTRDDDRLADVLEPQLCVLTLADGKQATRALFGWAVGVPTWRLAQERRLTPRGMRYRLKRWMQSLGVRWDERLPPSHSTHTAPCKGTEASVVIPLRVWSRGWVRNGQRSG